MQTKEEHVCDLESWGTYLWHAYVQYADSFLHCISLYIAPVLHNAPAVQIAVDPDWINVTFTFSEVSNLNCNVEVVWYCL